MATTHEQVAAHEAGHAIVGLAVGRKLLNITMIEGKHPEARLPGSPNATFITNLVPTTAQIEARLTFLQAVGGMAGEIVLEGEYHKEGAAGDLAELQTQVDDAQIQGLTKIAETIINANFALWHKIYRRMLSGIERGQTVLVEGAAINALFKHVGKQFTDHSELDRLLPLED